jgi:hypothetical protein
MGFGVANAHDPEKKKFFYPDSLSFSHFFLVRRESVRFYFWHDPSWFFGQAISEGFD